MKHLSLSLLLLIFSAVAFAQTNNGTTNIITTAVPFLNISPDARSGGMGEAGVALSPDVNAQYWNASKLVFLEQPTSFSLSYSPWLRNLVPGINLANFTFAHKLDDRSAIGASLRYFNLGAVDWYDENQTFLGTLNPNEYSLDASYSRKFGPNFSMGLALRYIHSNLTPGVTLNSQQTVPGNAVAADVSLSSTTPTQQFGRDAIFAFGVNISNIGSKISYVDGGAKYFLPTNLKIGAANTWLLDEGSKITLALDLNKLLVPTPPIRNANGDIISGRDDNRSVVSGIFSSFSDAPGGFSEEMKEISYSTGIEVWFNNQFAFRGGYYYENPYKGNRQYATFGAGLRSGDIEIDFSYIVAKQENSPLANMLHLSLGYALDGSKKPEHQ